MFSAKKNDAEQNDDQLIEFFKQFTSHGVSEFALSMAKLLYKKDEESNVIFSPICIYAALALVLLGAEGESFDEIATLMGLQDKNDKEADKCHQVLGRVLETIENTTDVTIWTEYEGEKNVKAIINVRNGVFVQDNIALIPRYCDRARSCYKSEISNLDFNNNPSKATDSINEFISNSTQQRIPRLLNNPVDNATRIILASCVYFKATWHHQFSEDETHDANFDTGSGKVLVKMMNLSKTVRYVDLPSLHFEAVSLDYAGYDVSMTIILPKPEKTLDEIVSSLQIDHLRQIEQHAKFEDVELKLPRMKFRWISKINDYLAQLGVNRVFDGRSKLTKMASDTRLKISSVTHAAEIEVDENGTEASAATVIEMVAYCALVMPKTPKQFYVDRPFLFYIHHRKTKAVLFLGTVHNPQKEAK